MNLTACFALLSKRGFNYCEVVMSGTGLASFTWSEGRNGHGDTVELEYNESSDNELMSMEITLRRSRIVYDEKDVPKHVTYEPYVYKVPEDEATEHALKHILDLSYDKLVPVEYKSDIIG